MATSRCDDFDSDDEEAAYIAADIEELLGTPFIDDPKSCGAWPRLQRLAILVRVKSLIPKIVAALDDARFPYVVGGVASLFDTRRGFAARMLFYYLAGEATEADLADAWRAPRPRHRRRRPRRGLAYARKTNADKEAARSASASTTCSARSSASSSTSDLREEEIVGRGEHGHTRGEVVYYNLGKFSQVISDFEQIYFQSNPQEKYRSFAGYLRYQADGIYPEGWLEARYVMPNAVQIMTIHQAKGLQWPVVFVPGLVKGRSPQGRRRRAAVECDSGRRRPEQGRLQDDRGGRATAVLRRRHARQEVPAADAGRLPNREAELAQPISVLGRGARGAR